MKINLKVRLKNPVFWAQILLAILMPIMVYFGVEWQDLTTWPTFGGLLLDAIKNPFVVGSILVSVWNALNDPTTPGIKDSKRALEYTLPGGTGGTE